MRNWQETEPRDRDRVRAVLRSSCCKADDIYDLVGRRGGSSYAGAIPALIEILPSLSSNRIKEGVVRALGVPQAAAAGQVLLDEFKALGPAESYSSRFELHLHWAIGNSLAAVAEDFLFEGLVELILDQKYGRAREMLTLALTRMRSRKNDALRVLLQCLADEDLTAHAIDALARMKATEAIPDIKRYITAPNRLVRSEAKKALRKLEQLAS